jgi:mono/diheme cytochrome c family protein
MNRNALKAFAISFLMAGLTACGGSGSNSSESAPPPKPMVTPEKEADPMDNKGLGPVTSLTLNDEIDQGMAEEGQKLYQQFCTACHKPTEKLIGPAPKGILERRSPEWVMNMILNPEQMIKEDPIAKKLFVEANMAPMANQGLTQDQARKILEYFRTL